MCVLLVNHSHGLEIIAGPPVLLTLVSREVSGPTVETDLMELDLYFVGTRWGKVFFRLKRISEALLDNSFGLYLLIPLTLSSGFCTRDIITIYRRQYEKRRHFRNALHSIKT